MIQPRRILHFTDKVFEAASTRVEIPLLRVAVAFVIENPWAGKKGADLQDMIAESPKLGEQMGDQIVSLLGGAEVQSYGKGGIVGLEGEQEHANALITTIFANPIRDRIGGGDAWISSFTKVAGPGASIDIPMNHKDDVYVRSHYDGMSVTIPGGPMPDEIAVIFCVATRGRINARVGGLTHEEVAMRKVAAG